MTPLEKIKNEIEISCQGCGRKASEVTLIAVSKLQPFLKIRELASEGQHQFGENYVQELQGKIAESASLNLKWHFIGHLQKNKAKLISGKCELIHSVDSLSLAELLGRRAVDAEQTENILFQINLGGESSKDGFSRVDFLQQWPQLQAIPGLRIHGLMTMPPLQNSPEENRKYFRELKEILETLPRRTEGHPLNQLSMGTSHDFKIAIEEGSTLIRLGTVLFGERPK